jgi:excinuclease ABC subunit C
MKEIISKLPNKPGCYIYKDDKDNVIYVGKAKNLKKRVSNYFNKLHEDIKTRLLVSNISSIDYIITTNEIEAFLLESNLIKKNKPKYNILLKDDKKYAYILITNEDFPRIITTRNKNISGDYYGPFTDGIVRNKIVKLLQDKFKLRTCKTFPKKPCLKYHINLCNAPCIGLQSKTDYNNTIDKIKIFFKGKTTELQKELEKEMNNYSKKQNFENAKEIKEQILALDYLSQKQIVNLDRLHEEDVITYKIINEKVYLILFEFKHGLLQNKKEFVIDNIIDFFDGFIKAYYFENPIPNEIILEQKLTDENIQDYLSQIANRKVQIIIPQKGVKKQLLDLAKENLNSQLKEKFTLAYQIKEKLNLEKEIHTIECFDISHLSGTNVVGSMVQFKDGKAVKTNYRRFKIKSFEGNDDFRAIAEMVYRRYKNLKENSMPYPDLIIIDGGYQQLTFAKKELNSLNLDIPIISLAKKLEEVYVWDNKVPYRFELSSDMMKLFVRIRDEAHRFAISYQRYLRKKEIK